MTLFCSPAVLLCLLAMVDPAAACFPLFLPQTLALPSFHCFSHLFHCYCLIILAQDIWHFFPFAVFLSWRHFARRYCCLCMFCDPFLSKNMALSSVLFFCYSFLFHSCCFLFLCSQKTHFWDNKEHLECIVEVYIFLLFRYFLYFVFPFNKQHVECMAEVYICRQWSIALPK